MCSSLLANLTKKVEESLEINFHNKYLWSDSSITLAWLKGDISRWKTFVANRVTEIISLTNKLDWHHVRSHENPADILTRGLSASSLKASKLWWHGPDWLEHPKAEWHISNIDLNFEIPEQHI